MEETPPKHPKKIRLTRSEAYAMRLRTPRKKKITFGLVGLLIAIALGIVLWHFQDLWLSYWLPDRPASPPTTVQATPPSTAPAPASDTPAPEPTAAAPAASATPEPAPPPTLDFLSATVWDHPRFLQGVRLFNQALDRQRAYLRDRSQPVLLTQAEEGALRAQQEFDALRPLAPPSVPIEPYAARCQALVQEIRRLRLPPPSAPATAKPTPPSPAPDVPPHRPGEPWRHPDYVQGARLFNQALEQYKIFLANKSRTELLKPIEEDAFLAAKKFESLKGQAPADVPLGDHITQCYKLISDCRRQHLEGGSTPQPTSPFDRGTTGPSRRPPLPAATPSP